MRVISPQEPASTALTHRRRPKVGLIVPRSNTTCEGELQDTARKRFSVHTARMKTVAGALAKDPQVVALEALTDPVEDLRLSRVDLVALGCTTAAMACDQDVLAAAMKATPDTKVVLISQSIVKALHAARASKIALFTPYTEAANRGLAAFLAANGFEVTAALGLSLNTSPDRFALVADLRAEYLLDEIKTMERGGADSLLISCTDLHTLDVIAPAADVLGVKVLSSNQAFFEDIEDALGF